MSERKPGRKKQLERARVDAKLDLVEMDPTITPEEVDRLLVEGGLTDDREALGREIERKVARVVKKSPLVRKVKLVPPKSEADLEGKDIVIEPKLRLRLLSEYYLQVKSGEKWIREFRQDVEDWLMTWREDLWQAKANLGKASPAFRKALDAAIDEELRRRKIIVINGGPKQTEEEIRTAFGEGVKALYSYWQKQATEAGK